MQVATGVWSRGLTFAIGFENGSWLSRAIPKARRIVEVCTARQHTKIEATTTNRYRTNNASDRTRPRIDGRREEACDGLPHVRNRDQDPPQEDRTDHEGAGDGREHGLGCRTPRVARLLRECARRVEPVDHVQAHEHRDEEERERDRRRELGEVAGRIRVEDHADPLVIVCDRQEDREHDHPEDLEEDPRVVDDRDDLHAVDVQDRDDGERDHAGDRLIRLPAPAEVRRQVPVEHRVQHREERQRQGGAPPMQRSGSLRSGRTTR